MRRRWLACVVMAISFWGSPARACEPARAIGSSEDLPAAWSESLDELIAATGDAEQPWGCSGGVVRLLVTDTGATLQVERDGVEPMSRHVETPDDLVPIGKAMLAGPMPIEVSYSAAPSPVPFVGNSASSNPDDVMSDDDVPSPSAARARIEGTGFARYAGVSELMMLGGGLRGTLPIGAWYGSLALRYLTMGKDLRSGTHDLGVWELGMMGAAGYSLVQDPVRLDLGLVAGVGIVNMSAASGDASQSDDEGDQDGEDQAEGSVVDGRMGMEVRLAIPIVDVLNALIALDAEVSFASLGNVDRRIDPALPPVPAYSLGLSAGLEVGVP